LEEARGVARAEEQRAEDVATRARQATPRVAELVAEREGPLVSAREARVADEAEYRAANEASRGSGLRHQSPLATSEAASAVSVLLVGRGERTLAEPAQGFGVVAAPRGGIEGGEWFGERRPDGRAERFAVLFLNELRDAFAGVLVHGAGEPVDFVVEAGLRWLSLLQRSLVRVDRRGQVAASAAGPPGAAGQFVAGGAFGLLQLGLLLAE